MPSELSPPSRRWTLVATILGSSLSFIDGTVVSVAMPALQADLQATITDIQWIIEAYALFLGALILVGGSLGDQFGRKRMFLAGVIVFTAASAVCGLAGSTRLLIAARAVQGVGAAFLVPGSLAIISATFDGVERGRAIGTWSGFSAITTAAGPIVGGWLIEHVSWRMVFFINVPLAAVILYLSRHMPESRDESRQSRIDWAGAALAVTGLGAVVFALLEWPRVGATSLVVATMVGGVAALCGFVVVEGRVSNPMLALGLFRSRTFTLANVLTLLLYGALATVFWLVPLNLIQVQHYSATAAGAAFLPFPVLLFVLSRWSGGLVASIGSRWPLTLGSLVSAIGLGLYAVPGIGGSYWTTFFPAVTVLGLGMSLVVAPLTTTVMTCVGPQRSGVASGVNNAVSRVAGLIAVAVLGVVLVRAFDERIVQALDRRGVPATARATLEPELPKLAGADVEALPSTDQMSARQAIDESFVHAFRVVMLVAAILAAVAAVTGAFIT